MKKRVLSALLAMLLVAACLSGCGKTNDNSNPESTGGSQSVSDSAGEGTSKTENDIKEIPVSDLEYADNSELGGIEIKKYNGKDTNIKIPSVIDGKSVTSIGKEAFLQRSSPTSITIPDGVTSIGDWAFSGCNLKSITIPDSVTSIGVNAFYACTYLKSITIPNGVTSIAANTFFSCSSLTSITIPNGVTSIGFAAFYGCRYLTSITIPDSVTSIGEDAFKECEKIQVTYKGNTYDFAHIDELYSAINSISNN